MIQVPEPGSAPGPLPLPRGRDAAAAVSAPGDRMGWFVRKFPGVILTASPAGQRLLRCARNDKGGCGRPSGRGLPSILLNRASVPAGGIARQRPRRSLRPLMLLGWFALLIRPAICPSRVLRKKSRAGDNQVPPSWTENKTTPASPLAESYRGMTVSETLTKV